MKDVQRQYESPKMRTVILKHRTCLLVGSPNPTSMHYNSSEKADDTEVGW